MYTIRVVQDSVASHCIVFEGVGDINATIIVVGSVIAKQCIVALSKS